MIPKTLPTHTAPISAPDGSPGEQASPRRSSDVQAPRTASPDLRILADKGHGGRVGRSLSDIGAQSMLRRHATLPRSAS
uniref:Uncharacterized protein n=3 Tax=Ralstonia solanacearum species complex TaxID=3116862 RepID=A0A0S4X0X1_RALSL|nr:protein of unknown function [Ralstonia solanacearum]